MARTVHEIFEAWKQAGPHDQAWKPHWTSEWKRQIDLYMKLKWAIIPIAIRQKTPLRAAPNYESHGAKGPYLSSIQACGWVSQGFNLAVVAGPSRLIIADLDSTKLFRKEWLNGLVAQTPRGYFIPLQLDESKKKITVKKAAELKKAGYDFREGELYELLPNSETCSFDHAPGAGKKSVKHPGPREPCVGFLGEVGHAHDYRVREFITPLDSPLLTFSQFLQAIDFDSS